MTEGTVNSMRFIETLEDLLGRGHVVRFQADGWSMHPTIRYGETIIVEPLGDSAVRTGDVLLYRHLRSAIAHRLVRVTSTELVLRGDAADSCDAPVSSDQLLGRVVAVERRGRTVRLDYLSGLWSSILARALRRFRICRAAIAQNRIGL
jgi:phage repressor protein C with HTH and peptisase S24 domain